jgi:hypothetical protein
MSVFCGGDFLEEVTPRAPFRNLRKMLRRPSFFEKHLAI